MSNKRLFNEAMGLLTALEQRYGRIPKHGVLPQFDNPKARRVHDRAVLRARRRARKMNAVYLAIAEYIA